MLKDNIDLTENQLFSKPAFFDGPPRLENLLRIGPKGNNIPWDIPVFTKVSSDDCYTVPLISLGNKEERLRDKRISKSVDSRYCDKCGKFLCEHPWTQEEYMCEDCKAILEARCNPGFPWTYKEKASE